MLTRALLLFATLLALKMVAGVDDGCKECICANSGGRVGTVCSMPPGGAAYCLNGVYCGPYGMSSNYWTDAGSHGGDFFTCMADWSCANATLDSYITKYCTPQFVGHAAPCSCEEVSRMHHCGPWSMHQPFCDTYWTQYMKPCLDNTSA